MAATPNVTFSLGQPDPAAFAQLRAECGWGLLPREVASKALAGGLITVICQDEGTLVGCGRVVGDGAVYFYLQDIIVRPDYQGRGIGKEIVHRLLSETKKRIASEGSIGLLAVNGKEAFYEQFGFIRRPTDGYGAGMSMHIQA